jgi:sulfatase maturation enzyme AslB (radical SAM superfamily)
LVNKQIANQLKLLRPNKVDITIPAMKKNIFERISGLPGSRNRVFRAIDLLHKNAVNLGFKSCLLKENASEIKDIENFAASLKVQHRLDALLSPQLDGSKGPYRHTEVA